jgi:prophage antirepressor-like protein
MNEPEQNKALVVFQGKKIRRIWYKDEWWFSVIDVVAALTDSVDPKQYIKKMRQRDPQLESKWGTICTPLEILAPDGKIRKTNCVNTEAAFRIIQSIPSPKAEPFKLRLKWFLHPAGQQALFGLVNQIFINDICSICAECEN